MNLFWSPVSITRYTAFGTLDTSHVSIEIPLAPAPLDKELLRADAQPFVAEGLRLAQSFAVSRHL